jgi:predicted nucleic acid-binding protein
MSDVEAAEWLSWLRGANVSEIGLDSILSEAFILSNQLAHPIYDCLYLAAAIRNNTRVITADRRFVAAVSRQPMLNRHIELLGKS